MTYDEEKKNRALDRLYGSGGRDLTPEGYREALSRLKASDSTAARQVERTLEPYLKEKIFPRKTIGWLNSSQGLRARLALLPGNPYLKADIRVVRRVLGIPKEQIKPNEDDPLWKEIASSEIKPKSIRKVWEGNIAGMWHSAHTLLASGKKDVLIDEESYGPLQVTMRLSAIKSARVQFTGKGVPKWLKQIPTGEPPYDSTGAPLDRAVGRLMERHRLPWRAASALTAYVLTENPEWIKDIELLSVSTSYSYYGLYETNANSITVEGIDEFITFKDWQRLWEQYIKRIQEKALRERAMKPQGRKAVDTARLKKYLPLYRKAIYEYKSVNDFVAKAKSYGKLYDGQDQETIRRALKDIDSLLRPVK